MTIFEVPALSDDGVNGVRVGVLKLSWIRVHQVGPLVLKHFGHAELLMLGVPNLFPQRSAPCARLGVELDKRAEAQLGRVDPVPPSAALGVLLD